MRVDDPGVLAAPTLRRVDDERALPERDSRQAAGGHVAALAGEDERPQVEVARRDAVGHERRSRRQVEDRLGDPVPRVAADRLGRGVEHVLFDPVTDHDAVAAALVGRLQHEFVKVLEHVVTLVFVHAAERRDVGDQRLLVQVVPNHVGHPGVHALVVGDTGARRIGDADVAGLPRPHQARHAERRIGVEHLRVEEEVVDAAVDDVDALEALDRLHVDAVVVVHDEIGALHELGPHPLGEERVLEVRRVVDARGEHDDLRVAPAGRGERHQQLVQLVGVRVDRSDQVPFEQLGERPLRDDPVLEHVAHTRRHAQVVLEHVELAVAGAHEIRAGDVRPHPELRMHATALLAEVRRVLEQLAREHPGGDDPLLVVDVVDEHVEGTQPLNQPLLDPAPLLTGDEPRDDVERPCPVDVLALRVDGERDPHGEDLEVGHPLALAQLVDAEPVEELHQIAGDRARSPVVLEQLVHEP